MRLARLREDWPVGQTAYPKPQTKVFVEREAQKHIDTAYELLRIANEHLTTAEILRKGA